MDETPRIYAEVSKYERTVRPLIPQGERIFVLTPTIRSVTMNLFQDHLWLLEDAPDDLVHFEAIWDGRADRAAQNAAPVFVHNILAAVRLHTKEQTSITGRPNNVPGQIHP